MVAGPTWDAFRILSGQGDRASSAEQSLGMGPASSIVRSCVPTSQPLYAAQRTHTRGWRNAQSRSSRAGMTPPRPHPFPSRISQLAANSKPVRARTSQREPRPARSTHTPPRSACPHNPCGRHHPARGAHPSGRAACAAWVRGTQGSHGVCPSRGVWTDGRIRRTKTAA